jgi:hypothetical protein
MEIDFHDNILSNRDVDQNIATYRANPVCGCIELDGLYGLIPLALRAVRSQFPVVVYDHCLSPLILVE